LHRYKKGRTLQIRLLEKDVPVNAFMTNEVLLDNWSVFGSNLPAAPIPQVFAQPRRLQPF
jgi:hypothetical protein